MERIKKVAFLKIYDVWFAKNKFLSSTWSISALHTNEMLNKNEYDFQQVAKTFIVDITGTEEAVFSKFDYKSARYAINKAIKDGVTVHTVQTSEERMQYWEFQKEFCKAKGIPCLNEDELSELTSFYALSKEGEYLGACSFIESEDGKTVRYKYGATLHKLNANEIILWEAMKQYKQRGFELFDMGGCVPTDDKGSYYYRHFHFKKKFGGELIDTYTYFKITGVYRIFYYIFIAMVKIFFKGDVNAFTNWINQRKILK